MSIEFTIDILEHDKDRLFVTGLALTAIAQGDEFSYLIQYGTSKKSRRQLASLTLTVETIIADGEPTAQIAPDTAAMLMLSGDVSAIETHARNLRWRKKKKRLIRTSDEALTLADEPL